MKSLREIPRRHSQTSAEIVRLNPHIYTTLIDKHSQEEIAEKSTKPKSEKRITLNKTETRMLDYLRARERRGDISNVRPFPLALHWGLDAEGHYMTYAPDMSYEINGRMILVEVKGAHVRSRDIVRFKGCRAEWDAKFGFEMWQWKERQWTRIL